MSDHHHIDKKLRDRFEFTEYNPSEEVWSRISNSLDRRKKRRKLILWMSAASVACLLILSAVWWQNERTPRPVTEQKLEKQSEPINNDQQEMHVPDQEVSDRGAEGNGDSKQPSETDVVIDRDENVTVASDGHSDGSSSQEHQAVAHNVILLQSIGMEGVFFIPSDWLSLNDTLFSGRKTMLKPSDFDVQPINDKSKSLSDAQVFVGLTTTPAGMLNSWSALTSRSSFVNKRFGEILQQSSLNSGMINYGVQFEVLLPSGISLLSGVNLNQFRENYAFNYEITEFPVVDDQKGIVGYLPLAPQDRVTVNESSANRWGLVQLPLAVSYHISLKDKRISLAPMAGFNAGLLFQSEGLLPDETNLGLQDLTDKVQDGFHLAAQLGLSLNFMPLEQLKFSMGPVYMRNMTNMANDESALQLRPGMLGWNLGVNWKIKK